VGCGGLVVLRAGILAGLFVMGGAFFVANFSFLAFCVHSGQVTSLAFAD